LSSGVARGVDFLLALRDECEDLSGKITLQGSNGIELRMSFGESASDVVLGLLVVRKGAMAMMCNALLAARISSTVEPMPDGLS
jgi:hypothetical protein